MREIKLFLSWAAATAVVILMVYGLVLVGQWLFDGGPSDDDRYRTCLNKGGSFQTKDQGYKCDMTGVIFQSQLEQRL